MATFTGTTSNDNFTGTDKKSDTFRFSPANLSAGDTVVGGDGKLNDRLEFTTGGLVTASVLNGISGIEVISLETGGITLQLSDAFATVNGSAGLLSIEGSSGAG